MKHATATDGYVQNKVSSVAAQLMKRGWLEFLASEKESVLTEVKDFVLGIHGRSAQYAAINFLESLVSEFSPSTSSAMGLPSEFHENCRSSFQKDYLQKFYCWAQDAAHNASGEIFEPWGTAGERVCSVAFRLMFQILNWDFKSAGDPLESLDSKAKLNLAMLKKFDFLLVQPGSSWRDVLISSGHVTWLLGLYKTMREKCSDDVLWFDSPLAVSVRQLIVHFCSLTGAIFPKDNGQTHQRHLLQLLSVVLKWIDPPAAVIAAIQNGQPESEFLDGCHALLSIAALTGTSLFNDLMKPISSFGGLQFLSTLTCEVIRGQGVQVGEEDIWYSEALDILLETWNVLTRGTDIYSSVLSLEGTEAIVLVFNTIVESQIKAASTSAFEELSESENFHAWLSARDEKLHSYALLARKVAHVSIPSIISLFSERFASLQQGKGVTDPTCLLEEIYWLLLVSGHILTDSGEGETVMVPDELLISFADISDAAHHPVVVLSWSIIRFAEQSLDPNMRSSFFSPRLMEAIVWFLSRWIGTFLMPMESSKLHFSDPNGGAAVHSKNLLLSFAGEDHDGRSLLDAIVCISLVALTSYPGEIELLSLTCQRMLPALVRRKNICVHLMTLDSWRKLSNAFVNENVLFSLPSRLQRFLAESLVSSFSAVKEHRASNQCIIDLMGPIAAYLLDMCSKDKLRTAQHPDTIFMVTCILERFRGAARATESRSQRAIFDVTVAVMDPMLKLLGVYKDQAAVVYAILKFTVDFVDAQVVFLSPNEMTTLVNFCMKLLQIYSSHNIGKISLSMSTSLLNEVKMEKYKDICALLQLLTHLCTKDLVDFSEASSEEAGTSVAEVVFLGLHIITPLVSMDLLKYPKLCRNYFELLSHLLEVYPEKVARLNGDTFNHIVATIDFGIRQQDSDVVDMCLRSVAALSTNHYTERAGGREGLGAYALTVYGSEGGLQEGFMCHFLRLLLQLILFEDIGMELAGSAADALLPLLLCEPEFYQRLVQEAMERLPHPSLGPRLARAMHALTSSNQLSASLDRANRQRFRKNLSQLLIDASGFMRIK
ncbi:exportin-4 protein isoform X2 [Wolffia australiana]